MKILIFSWRDIKNPKSGGAEVYTHEIAKRWVKLGNEVSLVSAGFPGSKPQEQIDGVKIFRPVFFDRYSPLDYLVYLAKTRNFYKKYYEGRVDIVIDQVHGLPLFCKFYVKEKVIALPCEVAKKIWFYEIPFPFSLFGYILEFVYLKYYRENHFLTISPSTARDLTSCGIKNVSYALPGISFKPVKLIPQKSQFALIVCLGRLNKMKRIDHTIRAFKDVSVNFPDARLVVVGRSSDEYTNNLKSLTKKLRIGNKVEFVGFISEIEKINLLKKAWLIVSTSLHEGWGINIIEAAACGTPAVAYKVPGLIDSVKDNETGILCPKNTPEELAYKLSLLISDHRLRLRLSSGALVYSRQFTWDKTATQSLKILKVVLELGQNGQITTPVGQTRRSQLQA